MDVEIIVAMVAAVISFISVVISLMAFKATRSTHTDEQTAEMIRHNYDEFLSLHEIRAQHPLQSHLFELGDEYDKVLEEIKAAVDWREESTARVRALRLQLEERAVARRVFSMYEHAYYQWMNAKRYEDSTRQEFLRDVLTYYTGRLLTNPRLGWYWSEGGANQANHYEAGTREYYARHVTVKRMDSEGPFQLEGPVILSE